MTKPTNQQRCLEAFLAEKATFDALLTDLQQMSDDHFSADPDAALWVETEELKRRNALLHQVTDAYVRRAEYSK